MADSEQAKLAEIPGVDTLLERDDIRDLCEEYPRETVVGSLRAVIDEVRRGILEGRDVVVDPDSIAAAAREVVHRSMAPTMKRAINAAGIVLHTALGRSMLAPEVASAVELACKRSATLQIDLETGRRGDRDLHTRDMFQKLTGCEDATFVNNNAGAVYLMLSTLCAGKEIVISRGQLVEIGGAFRMPDVIRASGATMVEVGTTNKTHLHDYERAIGPETAALLHAHQSNYRMIGFTKLVPIGEMTALAKENGILCLDDQGNGMLHDLTKYGLPHEPTVQESLAAGVDVICFSTDKLIGGPQGGALLGKRELIQRLRKHPMYRTLRPDKMAYTALWHTLKLHLDRDTAIERIPTLRNLTKPLDAIARDARKLAKIITRDVGGAADVAVMDGESEVGGGSMAGHPLPTKVVAVRAHGMGETELARRIRTRPVPIVSRTAQDAVLLDPRCVEADEISEIAAAIREVLSP